MDAGAWNVDETNSGGRVDLSALINELWKQARKDEKTYRRNDRKPSIAVSRHHLESAWTAVRNTRARTDDDSEDESWELLCDQDSMAEIMTRAGFPEPTAMLETLRGLAEEGCDHEKP